MPQLPPALRLISDEDGTYNLMMYWVSHGWAVFPLVPKDKVPYKESNGVLDATTDPTKIAAWAKKYPDCNVGGALEGKLAIDVDPRHGGQVPPWLPVTRKHLSGRGDGGCHFVYTLSAKQQLAGIRSGQSKLGPGIDIKTGSGAYVVLPGSIHPEGRRTFYTSDDEPFAEAPDELIERIRQAQSGSPSDSDQNRRGSALFDLLSNPPRREGDRGGRNNWLTKVAGHYATAYRNQEDLYWTHLNLANNTMPEPLDSDEVDKIGMSIWKSDQPDRDAYNALMARRDTATKSDWPDPDRFFGSSGLKALDLAEAVMESVICGFGTDDERFYVYEGGVWELGKSRLEAEIARLLNNRYRGSHATNALELIKHHSRTRRITRDPLPQYVNVPNGMVDWSAGTLEPHSPDYCSTVQLPVEYDPDAKCPEFEHFLEQVLPPDCLEFIWELIGYTMYSGNPLQLAVLLHGSGRNGKGTLIRFLERLLGTRNCSAVGLHDLLTNKYRAATLYGKLINLAGDLDSREVHNTALFKSITGGDLVQAEIKYGAAFDFTPWALPFYSINEAFKSPDSSEGWAARWLVVPFPNSFVGREDRNLDDRLQTEDELRGVLARGVSALPKLMKRGRFDEPESVRDAKVTFIKDSDAFKAFLYEHCEFDPEAWIKRSSLHRFYCLRTMGSGSAQLIAHEFYKRLRGMGIKEAKRTGIDGFKGIRIKDGPEDN